MEVELMPPALRERLGHTAAAGLCDLLHVERRERMEEMHLLQREITEGLAEVRVEMARGFAQNRVELSDGLGLVGKKIAAAHASLLRWSMLFWTSQMAVTIAIVLAMLKSRGL